MYCERCSSGAEAAYRVRTEILDMLVCSACANQARAIGISVEAATGKRKKLLSGLIRRGKLRVFPRTAHAR